MQSNSQVITPTKFSYKLLSKGEIALNEDVFRRAVEIGEYIVETKTTVRNAAKKFGVSKSTVHKDITQRLKQIDSILAKQVKRVLEENKAIRHIRGGMATKLKYDALKKLR